MSAIGLRDAAVARINEAVESEREILVDRFEDALDAMRWRQGVIAGMNRARLILKQAYMDLNL